MEPTEIMFKTLEEAEQYAEENDMDLVIESSLPEHQEAPYIALKYEWISDEMVLND